MFFKKKEWFKVTPRKDRVQDDKEEYMARMAKERIDTLFKEAETEASKGHMSQATRYIAMARKLAMKHNLKLTSDQKKKFCHSCYNYVVPGKTIDVRINSDYQAVEYICQSCGKVTRYGYGAEKDESKQNSIKKTKK